MLTLGASPSLLPSELSVEVLLAVALLVLFVSVFAAVLLGRRKQGREIREIVTALEELRSGQGRHRPDVSPRSPLSLVSDSVNRLSQDLAVRAADADDSAARLRALLLAEPDTGVVTTDDEVTIRSFSDAAERQFGWAEEEVRGSPLSILLDASTWEELLPRLSRRNLREQGLRLQGVLRRKDGSQFHGEMAVRGLHRGRDRDRSGLLVAIRDQSGRAELEERLEHAEARYRRLVEGLGAGVVLLEDGVVAFANPAFASLVGDDVTTEELSGVPFREFVATRDVLQVGATLDLLERGSTERAELRFALRSEGGGGRRLVRGEIARADGGDTPGLLVVLQDETSERRLEEELRQNERRLDAVLESAPEGVLALTDAPDGGFVHFTNRAFLEMFGLREDQVLGATEGGVLRALRERGGGAETVAAFLASAGGSARRETVTLESEPPVEVELRTSPLRDRSGRVLGRMLACRDTTAKRHGENALAQRADELHREMEALQEAHRRLEASNEDLVRQRSEMEEFNQELRKLDVMKSNLLANVSHELQTPLVSIRGYTEMILRGRLGDISEEQRKGLELSLRNIDRLIAMIDNLLEFSRMQREEGELTLEDFPLASVIDDCRELLRPKLERRRITCGLSLDDPDLVVHADRDKIQQVFLNLLSNAIKYNRDGGRVDVHARKTSHGLASIQVRDTGIGIATEDLDRIFDRFYHADQDRGTGLGLSIVRNILRLHGCTIRATSRKGEGTVFTFTLPLGERRESPDEPDAASGPANGEPGPGQPPDDGGDPSEEDGDPPRLRIIRPVGSDR